MQNRAAQLDRPEELAELLGHIVLVVGPPVRRRQRPRLQQFVEERRGERGRQRRQLADDPEQLEQRRRREPVRHQPTQPRVDLAGEVLRPGRGDERKHPSDLRRREFLRSPLRLDPAIHEVAGDDRGQTVDLLQASHRSTRLRLLAASPAVVGLPQRPQPSCIDLIALTGSLDRRFRQCVQSIDSILVFGEGLDEGHWVLADVVAQLRRRDVPQDRPHAGSEQALSPLLGLLARQAVLLPIGRQRLGRLQRDADALAEPLPLDGDEFVGPRLHPLRHRRRRQPHQNRPRLLLHPAGPV